MMDKLMGSVEKAKEGVSDFAETARLKREIGHLNDQKAERFLQIGKDAYALLVMRLELRNRAPLAVLQSLDAQIKAKAEEMTRINLQG